MLIGDLRESRTVKDRRALHRSLTEALGGADEATAPLAAGWVTAGDEFQAVHARLGSAVRYTLLVRLALHPVEARFGIGWGGVTLLDERTQDGPAWWAARSAIDTVHTLEDGAATRMARTAFRRAEAPHARDAGADDAHADEVDQADTPDLAGADLEAAINAALVCQDQVLGSCDERSIRILGGLVAGRSQQQIAVEEGVSASAVSQRVIRDGLAMVLRSHELLGRL